MTTIRLTERTPDSPFETYRSVDLPWSLTDAHPASSYGIPVLVRDSGEVFGHADIIPSRRLGMVAPKIRARDLVASWSQKTVLTESESEMVRRFDPTIVFSAAGQRDATDRRTSGHFAEAGDM